MKKICLCIILLLPILLYAETYRGFIYNNDDEPLIAASVFLGTDNTSTNEDGYFYLNSASNADSLIFYCFGYKIKKIAVEEYSGTEYIYLENRDFIMPSMVVVGKKNSETLPAAEEKVTITINQSDQAKDNVADVVSQSTAIQIQGTKLPGEKQSASILGHKARHTLVLLDGIPLNSNGEDFDLSSIPTEMVDEVEIYKNNTSSLSGGGGGIAGAINIKTKKSAANNGQASIGLKYGSFNYMKGSVSTNFNMANASVYAVISEMKTDNNYKYKKEEGNNTVSNKKRKNSKRSNDFMANISCKFNLFDIYLSTNTIAYNNDLSSINIEFIDAFDGAKARGYDSYNSLKIKNKFGLFTNTIESYYINKESDYINDQTGTNFDMAFSSDTESNNSKINYKLTNKLNYENFNLAISHSYLQENMKFDDNIHEKNDMNVSQFAYSASAISQYKKDWNFLEVNVIGSYRFDKYNNFSNYNSYRIASDIKYNWIVIPTLILSYGNSYNVPSFFSLYWAGDAQSTGNQKLKVEKSKGYQCGLKLEYDTFDCKAIYSSNDIDDLIQWIIVNDNGRKWKPMNIGNYQINNWEFEVNWEPLKWTKIFGSYLLTNAKDMTNNSDTYNKRLMYTPNYIRKIGIDFNLKKLNMGIEYTKTGNQTTTVDDLMSDLRISSYELINAHISQKFRTGRFKHVASLQLNNLLNKYYEIHVFQPEAPFNWCISWNVTLKF